jgi:hypothetical protein
MPPGEWRPQVTGARARPGRGPQVTGASARPAWRSRRLVNAAALTAAAVSGLLAVAACGGPATPSHDHGRVVAHLAIPFQPPVATGNPDIIRVTVTVGQRFSIKVDTSDGPFDWSQLTRPDPRIAWLAGNFGDGSCAAGLVGCRVPYFHTLIARGRGTTAMSWKYHDLRCEAAQATASPGPSASPGASARPGIGPCPSVTRVTFDITVH